MRRGSHRFPIVYGHADGLIRRGTVRSASRDAIDLGGPSLSPGDIVEVGCENGARPLCAQVARVDLDIARCTPLESVSKVRAGDGFACANGRLGAYVGGALLGRALDAWGRSEAGRPIPGASIAALQADPLPPASRVPIGRAMRTGVAAIDAFATIGYGQRVSLTAGAGVGKTTLLRRIVESADVDARVVALVGERGREAAETAARLRCLPCWRATSLYCAPSDARPLQRFAVARSATAQAEWLCRDGRRVLLVVDSLTRTALAWREIALANGEPPAARGHPPSLNSALATLVERAGARRHGSITAIYTVLAEGDDPSEPVTDALRAMLDGHVALSRRHADAARHPAIDVLRSLSRAMPGIVSAGHAADASLVRHALAALEDAADLIAIGAYRPGADAWLDACVALRGTIEGLIFDRDGGPGDPIGRLADIAAQLRRTPGLPPARA